MKRIILLIPILAILSLLAGCKTKTVLVPVTETKIEYRDRLRIDSVYNRDTVNIYERGDTVYLRTIKWRERFRIDTEISAKILVVGMTKGLFTGKKLADYFNSEKEDWINARRIVNGLDRASDIANHSKKFLHCIRMSNERL